MKQLLLVCVWCICLGTPSYAHALEVSGWIPYWAGTDGAKSARENIETLSVVMPFSFVVTSNGDLKDLGKMKKSHWKKLSDDAKANDVLVIPTVMTSDGVALHTLLSNPETRKHHIDEIVRMVTKGKYDGVDIDYEGKRASTREYYSLFLKELKEALNEKVLSCTIEARTPPESLYRTVPTSIEYANDLPEINRHCDRVTIMTYDQQRADLLLNSARKGTPYYPVADSDWVRKVAEYMDNDIDREKLVLGVATYGREVEVKVSPEWFESYTQIRAVNPGAAKKTARTFKVRPSENKAGEQSFTYLPKNSQIKLRELPEAPRGSANGEEVALRALAYANKTGESLPIRMVWWSDAAAIKDKIDIAEDLGLLGVAIFKIDGEEDEKLWDLF